MVVNYLYVGDKYVNENQYLWIVLTIDKFGIDCDDDELLRKLLNRCLGLIQKNFQLCFESNNFNTFLDNVGTLLNIAENIDGNSMSVYYNTYVNMITDHFVCFLTMMKNNYDSDVLRLHPFFVNKILGTKIGRHLIGAHKLTPFVDELKV